MQSGWDGRAFFLGQPCLEIGQVHDCFVFDGASRATAQDVGNPVQQGHRRVVTLTWSEFGWDT